MNTTRFSKLKKDLQDCTPSQLSQIMKILTTESEPSSAVRIIRDLFKQYRDLISDYDRDLMLFSLLSGSEYQMLIKHRENIQINHELEAELLRNFRICNSEAQCHLLNYASEQADQQKYDNAVIKQKDNPLFKLINY